MDLEINGRTAFITGGSRGIGRAIASELAKAGCKVGITARNPAGVEAAVAELRNEGADAFGVSADVSRPEEITRAIDECEAVLGKTTIAIFNPPTPVLGSVLELTEDDFARTFSDLVLCFMRMVKHLAPGMREAGFGRVVTIGSMATKQPARGQLGFDYAPANVCRLAATAMSRTLAAELGGYGITINSIATGSIASGAGVDFLHEMAAKNNMSNDEYEAMVFRHTTVGRIGKLEEIASLAGYLCSVRAGYTNGENILCDGGLANAAI